MQARCKPGDIAVILYDEPECLMNVGRLVRVHPSLALNEELNLECWLIEPLDGSTWAVSESDGSISFAILDHDDRIEHPDAWMLPIKDDSLPKESTSVMSEEEFRAYSRIQEKIDQNLLEIGAINRRWFPESENVISMKEDSDVVTHCHITTRGGD